MERITSPEHSPESGRAHAARRLAQTGTVLSAAVLAAALTWLVLPHAGPFAAGLSPVEQLAAAAGVNASLVAAGVLAAAAALTLAAGTAVLAGRTTARGPSRTIAAVAAGTVAIGLVGFDGIVIAGYSLAFVLPFGVVALVALLAVRRPLAGAVLAIGLAVAALALQGSLPIGEFLGRYAAAVADDPVRFGTSIVLIAYVGAWVLWSATAPSLASGRIAALAERHRRILTIAAAACAAPYVVARASWLTPWPLFGGSAELFTSHPDIRVVGLMLGAALLVGAVLTLGLILPWGSRVPRWVPGLGGAPVPVPLVVVPASVAAILFTAGGLQSLILAATGAVTPEVVLVLPFWLWGPLLALATLGYARRRSTRTTTTATTARTGSTMAGSQ